MCKKKIFKIKVNKFSLSHTAENTSSEYAWRKKVTAQKKKVIICKLAGMCLRQIKGPSPHHSQS